MSITNDEIVTLIKSAKKNSKNLTHITNKKSLSAQDKFKMSLCRLFVQYVNEKKILARELSETLGIPKSRVSEICNYKINSFTVDKLLSLLEDLGQHSPKIREHLIMLEQAMEIPVMRVREAKFLTRTLKHVAHEGVNTDSQYAF